MIGGNLAVDRERALERVDQKVNQQKPLLLPWISGPASTEVQIADVDKHKNQSLSLKHFIRNYVL
jgi:hypothetical protein